jgi:acetyl-CoA acetyltransferase
VLNSRMIVYPFRLLQCCLVTDGGGALILVSAERAKDFRKNQFIRHRQAPRRRWSARPSFMRKQESAGPTI